MRTVTDKATGEIREFTEEQFIAERDRLLTAWQASAKRLEAAKAEEMELRRQSVEFISDETKISGTENIELGNGYKAKVVKKVTYGFVSNAEGKLDRDRLEAALKKIESNSAAGSYIADNLVKWNPTLSVTEYNKLGTNDKAAIDAVIVTKEGAPTLDIVEPKAPKA